MVADVPVGVLLSGGLDSSLIVALLAEEGQRGLATFSIGFPDAGGREGDEFAFSDAVAERFATDHRQIRVGTDELVDALPQAIAAMGEPMVSHDCVAFWLLSRRCGATARSSSPARARTRCSAATAGTRRCSTRPGTGLDTYAAEFFDRDDAGVRALVAPGALPGDDVSRAFAAAGSRAPAPPRRSTGRCGSTPR